MRIIAGKAKGRTLLAPAGEHTRPTSDKIRGALFNMLYSRVEGAYVLDLFGGTGAFGLEALSRGAEKAVIVDNDRRAIEAIKRNHASVGGSADIVKADYLSAIDRLADRFDIVFLDPPYMMTDAYAKAIAALIDRGRLNEGAAVICERRRSASVEYPEGVKLNGAREYGDTAVDILEYGD